MMLSGSCKAKYCVCGHPFITVQSSVACFSIRYSIPTSTRCSHSVTSHRNLNFRLNFRRAALALSRAWSALECIGVWSWRNVTSCLMNNCAGSRSTPTLKKCQK